jgi:hypothetical protein
MFYLCMVMIAWMTVISVMSIIAVKTNISDVHDVQRYENSFEIREGPNNAFPEHCFINVSKPASTTDAQYRNLNNKYRYVLALYSI